MIKSGFKFLAASVLFLSMVSCNSDDDSEDLGNWITQSVFDGSPRSSAVSFVINNFGYVGTGYDGDDYLNDFWQYNMDGNYWVQKADFPGEDRSSASAFTIGNKGYIGTGYNGTDELSDFYGYDPETNTWTQIADFAGTPRRAAVGFESDSYGYVGSGFDGDNDRKDFWKYDPVNNAWEELLGFGGNKRREATTFTIGNMVYFGTGTSNGVYVTDFWSFNTDTEIWTRLRDIDYEDDYSVERSNASGFAIGNYGYVCGGDNLTGVWEYNPATDTWDSKTNIEASVRQDAVAFSTGARGFVLLGRYGNYYFDDMYELKPFDEQQDDD